MQSKEKIFLALATVAIIIVYGFAAALGVMRFDNWRTEKSQEYLNKAKNEQNLTTKFNYLQKAALLRPSEKTYLLAGASAVAMDNGPIAEKYLSKLHSAESKLELGKALLKQGKFDEARTALGIAFTELRTEEVSRLLYLAGGDGQYLDVSREINKANRSTLIYNALLDLGYPHAAIVRLNQLAETELLGRDALIELAKWQMSNGEESKAYESLLEAVKIDPYYPQIYQQLVQVCEKLGKTDEAVQYRTFLEKIIF